jgi:hypothetical protein
MLVLAAHVTLCEHEDIAEASLYNPFPRLK